jgi:polyhydroxyalkanoate synthesis regulator phasin
MADEKTPAADDIGLVEKAFLMGVGAAMLAKEKAEELAEELVSRGKLTREQSDSFVSRMVDRADEAGRSVQTTVAKETERVVSGMGLASTKDLDEIRGELTEIKALIASLRPLGNDTDES